jgi:hypothetical protein
VINGNWGNISGEVGMMTGGVVMVIGENWATEQGRCGWEIITVWEGIIRVVKLTIVMRITTSTVSVMTRVRIIDRIDRSAIALKSPIRIIVVHQAGTIRISNIDTVGTCSGRIHVHRSIDRDGVGCWWVLGRTKVRQN